MNYKASEKKLDWFNEAINIHHNTFRHTGYKPPMLDINDASTAITALIWLKGGGSSAHILTDGQVDKLGDCGAYPVDKDGISLKLANPGEKDRVNPRQTTLGGRNYGISDPMLGCHYTDGKFNISYNWLLGKQGALRDDLRVYHRQPVRPVDAALPERQRVEQRLH